MAKVKLQPKKEKWVKQFKPTMLKGTPLKDSKAIEERTRIETEKLTRYMIREVEEEIEKLFKKKESKEYIQNALDASLTSQTRILMNMLAKKTAQIFSDKGSLISEKMVRSVDKHTKSSIQRSIKDLSGGTAIDTTKLSSTTKENIKSSVEQATDYIVSIQSEYMTQVKGAVYRSITSGRGLADLVPELQRLGTKTKKRARIIALDQTRKTTNSLNLARMNQNGITHFEWNHSGGSLHPRSLHQNLDGQIFPIDRPPVIDENGTRGYPSELPNCRCFMTPILDLQNYR